MDNTGLTEKQVIESRKKHGSNTISKKKKSNFFSLFIESLGDPIIKVLIIVLIIKTIFLIGDFDWYETVGIAIAIFLASFISTLSEYGSEEAFKKLQEEASRIQCKVYRDRSLKQIFVEDVVVNDVILLQSGDKVPADGILINGGIYVDESALNGESKETFKDTNTNKLFKGTIVCSGEAKMLVQSVGDHTLYGNIALELQSEQRESPLKLRLRMLAKMISHLGFIGATLVSISYLFNVILIKNDFNIDQIREMISNVPLILGHALHALTLAVTVIVVAVPEGLPMMITLVLSSNMRKMLKDNVLVRKLMGIETSGSINILFADKTGTITKGKLKVINFIGGENKEYDLNTLDRKEGLFNLLKLSLIYNNGAAMDSNKKIAIGGNATDRALLEFIYPFNNNMLNIKKEKVVPFDSNSKISMTKISGKYDLTLIKGAPEKILKSCYYYYDDKGNKNRLLGKDFLHKKLSDLALKGIRCIAMATFTDNIYNLTLVGIIGIRDEIRKEAAKTIKDVEEAGIQVVMITGDAKETASAIAKEVGLLESNNIVLTSDELKNLDDEQIKKMIPNLRVIARALPTDKSRLVKIAQEKGLVVGMTGDGVNDAPALKKADVGFAMGSGTEVAKEASDIVILDDNFLSISKAILYGRTIFKSIRKFIIFQLTVNLCAVGVSIIGPFIGVNTPITVIQMLWINMVMDTLAALAFAGEPPLKEYMKEKPKKRDEPIINYYMKDQIIMTGIYSLVLCLVFLKVSNIKYLFGNGSDNIYLMTAFFALFIFISLFNSFNARTHRLNLLSHIISNRGFIIIMLLVTIIQMYIIYHGGVLFRVIGLKSNELLIIIGLSMTVIPVDWLRKLYLRFNHEVGGV
jgi:calcium-translocating P-type ATPase